MVKEFEFYKGTQPGVWYVPYLIYQNGDVQMIGVDVYEWANEVGTSQPAKYLKKVTDWRGQGKFNILKKLSELLKGEPPHLKIDVKLVKKYKMIKFVFGIVR